MTEFIAAEKLAEFKAADPDNNLLWGPLDNAYKIFVALAVPEDEIMNKVYGPRINRENLAQLLPDADAQIFQNLKNIGGAFIGDIEKQHPALPKQKVRLYWSLLYHCLNEAKEKKGREGIEKMFSLLDMGQIIPLEELRAQKNTLAELSRNTNLLRE